MSQAKKDQLLILIPTFSQVQQGKYPAYADKFVDLTPADLVVSDIVIANGKVTATVASATRHFTDRANQSWKQANINNAKVFELSALADVEAPVLADLAYAAEAGVYAYTDEAGAAKVAVVVLPVEGSTTADLAHALVVDKAVYALGGEHDTITADDDSVSIETPFLAGELVVVVGGQVRDLELGEQDLGDLSV